MAPGRFSKRTGGLLTALLPIGLNLLSSLFSGGSSNNNNQQQQTQQQQQSFQQRGPRGPPGQRMNGPPGMNKQGPPQMKPNQTMQQIQTQPIRGVGRNS